MVQSAHQGKGRYCLLLRPDDRSLGEPPTLQAKFSFSPNYTPSLNWLLRNIKVEREREWPPQRDYLILSRITFVLVNWHHSGLCLCPLRGSLVICFMLKNLAPRLVSWSIPREVDWWHGHGCGHGRNLPASLSSVSFMLHMHSFRIIGYDHWMKSLRYRIC